MQQQQQQQQQSSSMMRQPIVQHAASSIGSGGGGGGGGSLSEISSFFKEQREEARAERAELTRELKQQQREMESRLDAKDVKLEQQRKQAEQQRKEMEAKIEQQQATIHQQELLRAELSAAPAPVPAITEEQLAALQARIEGLHLTKLLADDELFALEDLIADYVELTMSVADRVITREMIYSLQTIAVASKLDQLVGLSAAMAGDAAFARQARRKFLS
jgi:small-conductance mechanosensitive channel